jgi:omega-amidase
VPIEVAAAQIPVGWDLEENLSWIANAAVEAGDAELLVLPEGAISGYDPELSELEHLRRDAIQEAIEAVAAIAVRHRTHLFCGSLLHDEGEWWNAALCFSAQGGLEIYRKVNLATRERGRLAAGVELATFGLEAGGTRIEVGCQICRELRFPEQWHCLATRGAQLFAYLTYAADPAGPDGVWRSHLISRAAETQRYVAGANVAKPGRHCPTIIISPQGRVLAEAQTEAATVIRARVDLDTVANWYLDQQRGDVVEIAYRPETTAS